METFYSVNGTDGLRNWTVWFHDLEWAREIAKHYKTRLKVHNVYDKNRIRELWSLVDYWCNDIRG